MRPLQSCILLLLGLASAVNAQEKLRKNVDAREIIRRGNMVEHVTNDIADENPATRAIAQMAETPVSDIDKWFISVIGLKDKDCPACAKLHKQWETSEILRAYAVPESPKDSWAHFTWYDYNDPYQKWRWTKSEKNPNALRIDAFPTIVVQPPRSGKFGNPKIIVYKAVYQGDPRQFHDDLNASLHSYVEALQNNSPGPKSTEDVLNNGERLIGGTSGDPIPVAAKEVGGIGQQTIPPINFPLDNPKEPVDDPAADSAPPRFPLAQGLRSSLVDSTEVVVVRDKEQRSDAAMEAAINTQVQKMQGRGKPHKVKEKDIATAAKLYGISPDECPVVLQVSGKKVLQKVPITEEEAGKSSFTFWILLDQLFGGGSMLSAVFFVFKVMAGLFVLMVVVVLIMVVIMSARRPPGPTVVNSTPAIDYAALAAAVTAAQQTKA